MPRDEFVSDLMAQANKGWNEYWAGLPDEQRLRLSGMEEELGELTRQLQRSLWALLGARSGKACGRN